nr:DUF1722 domain-containing protein [Acetobacterium wieringae]
MAYSQKEKKLLGQIVANHDKLPVAAVIAGYKNGLGTGQNPPL